MRKFLIVLCVVLSVLAANQSASALVFTLDSYAVTLNTADPGLVLYWNPILTTPVPHDFSVGEQITVDLFTVGTTEDWSNSDDKVHKPISVAFNFSAPSLLGSVTGESWGKVALWVISYGKIEWDDPILLSFGNGGQFSIDLGDVSFCTPGSAIVPATFKYVSAPVSVPEPATMLLVGCGLICLAGLGRKRFITKA